MLIASMPVVRADENLFPVKVGSSWKMKGNAGAQNVEMVAKIVSSTTTVGSTIVGMQWTQGGRAIQDETYIVSKTQVVRSRSGAKGSSALNPPIPIIVYPMVVGKSWKWSGTIVTKGGQTKASATLKVGPKEKVYTAAGIFNTYRVNMVLAIQAGAKTISMPNSYWFAPNVGMVQQKLAIPTPNGKFLVVKAVVTEVKVK